MICGFVKYARDPLYRNSFFIMLSSVTNAVSGFLFWMVAARLYFLEDVKIRIRAQIIMEAERYWMRSIMLSREWQEELE